jgi:hypothetical protein
MLVKHVRPWVAVVSDQLERAQRDGFVHADVDVEAYAVHVIHLVVGGVAVMETMGAALGGRSSVTRERMAKELVRLARAGLFVDPSRTTRSDRARSESARSESARSESARSESARTERTGPKRGK